MEIMAGSEHTVPAQATVIILGRSPGLWQLTITAGTGYSILDVYKRQVSDYYYSAEPDG